ncbi:MAG: DUF4332 domain-containing protein, partial [Planctomycetales bacterium]|nr:DUF4332 domain-containing protein [Planctomycetales bacterium]
PSGYQVVRDHLGQTKIAYTAAYENSVDSAILPEMLVSMQKDLQEVCQQLARHESDTACETLRAQSQQLRRCETELLQSVEKLIEERASLLRKIADEHHLSVNQLTLAFGQWCQCHDHMNLHDWLLREEAQASKEVSQAGSLGRQRYELLDEIESLTARRKQADLRGDECRRQLRNLSVPLVGHPYSHAATNGGNQLLTELSDIDAQLNRLTQRERIQAELAEVTRQLTLDGRSDSALNSFDAAVNQHIAAIMGGFSRTQADRAYRSSRPTLPIDERRLGAPALEYETYEKTVPKEIVCVAIRIAITEAMRARHEPIPLFVDGSLDHMPAEYQQRTLEYLAQLALQGQQVVVLTSDDLVAQQVYHLRGWVGYLNVETQRPTRDVNRQLAAYANEHEADKWYQPAPAEKPFRETRGEYYLNDLSLIEESPSVSAVDASRCRALGIDRIGDLLDADPTWLAENLKIDGVSTSIVSGWQAEARLLCSVRHLRPFDARIIVGAGVRTPQQLAEMQPAQLLE